MALTSAAPAKAVPEVLRNSRRVVRFESVRLLEFIELVMFAFARFELFMAVERMIPFRPALGKSVHSPQPISGPFRGLHLKCALIGYGAHL
jgi:hypothetical protein